MSIYQIKLQIICRYYLKIQYNKNIEQYFKKKLGYKCFVILYIKSNIKVEIVPNHVEL